MNNSKLWALAAQCFLNLDEDIYSVIFPVVVLYLSLGFRKQVDSWERCVLLFLSARRSGIPQRTDKFPASTDETLSQCSQLMFQFSVENDKRKKKLLAGNKANILFRGLLKAHGGCSVEALARSYELWCLLSLFPPKQSGILKFM